MNEARNGSVRNKSATQGIMKRTPETHAEQREKWTGPPVAVFWDQSLLWGLICLETLQQLGVPFQLLCAKEIAGGSLDRHRVLLVPGGWASHKVHALAEGGKMQVRQFVERGGSYLGFCGGAGLALSSPSSLGLVPLKRMPLAERLPNASGEIWIRGVPDHPLWEGLPSTLPVCIWWPSQFVMETAPESLCLATYVAPGGDFWIADLPFSDLPDKSVPWREWETIYGINLDPSRLFGHPAIVEARRGKGKLILSYPHLDTPEHPWANRLFLRSLQYLDREAAPNFPRKAATAASPIRPAGPPGAQTLEHIRLAGEAAAALIRFGERQLLWNWRLPWLLNWRRGIRGLEYGTLAVVLTHLMNHLERLSKEGAEDGDPWLETAQKIAGQVACFCNLARSLLLEEKLATQTRNLTKLGRVNVTVDRLRTQLFGDKMNHGGLCRELFDQLDGVLLEVLRKSQGSDPRQGELKSS